MCHETARDGLNPPGPDSECFLQAAGNSPPFLSSTTYKSELLDGQATAQQQLQQSQGLNSNLVTYKVARDRRVQSASPCMREHALSSTTACTSNGELIGYKTTYATTTALAAEKAAGAKAAAAARPMSCTGTERLRLAVSGEQLRLQEINHICAFTEQHGHLNTSRELTTPSWVGWKADEQCM